MGRVVHSLKAGNFVDLGRPAATLWNSETEARYMEQVRERAQQKAKEILQQALDEAEVLRARARTEGFEDGRAAAQDLCAAEASRTAAFLASLHDALKTEKERAFALHRHTLFKILTLAFEKTLGIMLDAHRQQVLTSLFEEAVAQLQATSTITVHVCAEDLELAKQLAVQVRSQTQNLPDLCIKLNQDLTPGGVRLECGDGMVDNTIASRFEQVQAILVGYQEAP